MSFINILWLPVIFLSELSPPRVVEWLPRPVWKPRDHLLVGSEAVRETLQHFGVLGGGVGGGGGGNRKSLAAWRTRYGKNPATNTWPSHVADISILPHLMVHYVMKNLLKHLKKDFDHLSTFFYIFTISWSGFEKFLIVR